MVPSAESNTKDMFPRHMLTYLHTQLWGCRAKLVTAQFKKKPYRQNTDEVEEPPELFFSQQAKPIRTTARNWKRKQKDVKRE